MNTERGKERAEKRERERKNGVCIKGERIYGDLVKANERETERKRRVSVRERGKKLQGKKERKKER